MVLVKEAFGDGGFDINNRDMDRISVGRNNTKYMLRMWNIKDKKIEWTLFTVVKHKDGGDHVVEEKDDVFFR